MEQAPIKLTEVDRMILESYKDFAEGLSDYLSDCYEIVLHDLENMDHSVIKILNGYHTGRREGAPITDLALEMLAKMRSSNDKPYITYLCKNKKDEPLRSTTIAIKGEGGRIIGVMCINFYLDSPFSDVIASLCTVGGRTTVSRSENFAENVSETIEKSMISARQRVMEDERILPSQRNREIIRELYQNGVFNLKDAVIYISNLLGISRNTVYLHIRNIAQESSLERIELEE